MPSRRRNPWYRLSVPKYVLTTSPRALIEVRCEGWVVDTAFGKSMEVNVSFSAALSERTITKAPAKTFLLNIFNLLFEVLSVDCGFVILTAFKQDNQIQTVESDGALYHACALILR